MTEARRSVGAERRSARAFGKVIVLGEHAVVYGVPALVGGLLRGVDARVGHPEAGAGQLRFLEPYRAAAKQHRVATDRAWSALCGVEPKLGPVEAELSGDLPAGMGLGFSAAAGVALARAVERLRVGDAAPSIVEARAMAWERVFHGNPSGVDVAAAMRGGLLRFVRGQPFEAVPTDAEMELVIGLTGVPSATRPMVERVAELRRSRPRRVARAVEQIGRAVEEGIEAARAADDGRLGATLERAQELLCELEVSTPTIDRMCRAAREAGALGAKLTGSGGGGAVIALCGFRRAGPRGESVAARARSILSSWQQQGWEAFAAAVGMAERERPEETT
ncbi:MAG: mevalonate kinase [Deltaproteobacteria bacterium]|nr:mevalonate kinase [Deltaproteobacteria bacterium]